MKYGMLIALMALIAVAGQAQDSPDKPQQVSVSVKIIEFQATKGVETGLSAYFQRREKVDWWGIVRPPKQGLMSADVTFPTSTSGGITVFLDRLRMTEGDVEMILQGLVDDNRAFILSQPKVMVMVGGTSAINTVDEVPYENTAVVGATTVQSTDFKKTGVTLNIGVPNIIDMDGDWRTSQDTFIQLNVSAAVSEEGQRLVVALADRQNTTGILDNNNAISVPEFVNRSIITTVYVNSGQVLVMGGLYSNTKSKTLTTVPWLKQTEDVAVGLAERVIPGDSIESPLSSVFGHRKSSASRRELVFLIKAEVWRPSYTVANENGMAPADTGASKKASPSDVISNVLTGISELPQEIGEGLKKQDSSDSGIESQLGAKGKK